MLTREEFAKLFVALLKDFDLVEGSPQIQHLSDSRLQFQLNPLFTVWIDWSPAWGSEIELPTLSLLHHAGVIRKYGEELLEKGAVITLPRPIERIQDEDVISIYMGFISKQCELIRQKLDEEFLD